LSILANDSWIIIFFSENFNTINKLKKISILQKHQNEETKYPKGENNDTVQDTWKNVGLWEITFTTTTFSLNFYAKYMLENRASHKSNQVLLLISFSFHIKLILRTFTIFRE